MACHLVWHVIWLMWGQKEHIFSLHQPNDMPNGADMCLALSPCHDYFSICLFSLKIKIKSIIQTKLIAPSPHVSSNNTFLLDDTNT